MVAQKAAARSVKTSLKPKKIAQVSEFKKNAGKSKASQKSSSFESEDRRKNKPGSSKPKQRNNNTRVGKGKKKTWKR